MFVVRARKKGREGKRKDNRVDRRERSVCAWYERECVCTYCDRVWVLRERVWLCVVRKRRKERKRGESDFMLVCYENVYVCCEREGERKEQESKRKCVCVCFCGCMFVVRGEREGGKEGMRREWEKRKGRVCVCACAFCKERERGGERGGGKE